MNGSGRPEPLKKGEMSMFKPFLNTEPIRSLVFEDFAPKCSALRGVYVLKDELSRGLLILICGTNPGTSYSGGGPNHSRELAIIRAELPNFGVEELLFADLATEGYVLVVRPTDPMEKAKTLAEGCWTFTPGSEMKLGRLLKGLTELAWRAWEEAVLPQLAEQQAQLDPPGDDELEDEDTESEQGSAFGSGDQASPSPTPEAAPEAVPDPAKEGNTY
jgi:hypothetical protein